MAMTEEQRKYHRDWYAANRARIHERKRKLAKENQQRSRENLWAYLEEHACVDCGESDPIVLEFDHRDGVEKVGNISEMICTHGWLSILAEIEKCDVRCANCHRRRTAKQQGWFYGKQRDVAQ